MKFKLGTMRGNQAVYIPKGMLTESVIGQIYEIKINTRGVSDPAVVAATLKVKLKEKFNATLHYFSVDNNIITIQIEGSPFVWAALLLFLPQILLTIGIIVLFIVVYLLVSSVPSWVYAAGAVALGLVFISTKVGGSKK